MAEKRQQEQRGKGETGGTREKGSEYFSEIGKKGGETVSRDREHMAEIGRKGGQASHERRGRGEEPKKEKAA